MIQPGLKNWIDILRKETNQQKERPDRIQEMCLYVNTFEIIFKYCIEFKYNAMLNLFNIYT